MFGDHGEQVEMGEQISVKQPIFNGRGGPLGLPIVIGAPKKYVLTVNHD